MYINYHFKVGIFYTDEEWADKKFKEFIETEPCDDSKARKNYKIIVTGPVMIEFIKISPAARGYRFDRIYYQSTIRQDMVDQILKPAVSFSSPIPLK